MSTAWERPPEYDDPPEPPDEVSDDCDFCGCQQDECPHCNRWCHYCGGDGWGISGDSWPVDDPVNDCPGEVEECPCCHGSGLAKDCTFW